ncbi:lymphatic vessel endothelial hyaluronic receptor 1b [Periophthalmus magnuspinnatus]|uniref:lymphatic vessel endothelial hyaluronic receptor 1b n=1 Tax=Periophthalmus magnuspinnatus TaxID=409849 RepID=UPI00243643B7|nr:lymphatic vessel endothelial hyaluronic receptor 1b [Periophthalmus magnuspinnatus]
MELFGFFLFLILTDFSSSLDHSLIAVSPISPVSGVLLLTGPMEQYQFDFSEAQEACLFKNVSMATRPQLQKALDHGLEACRFGWLSEQIAAVPRLSSVSTCGSGKTGVVTWNAETNRKFGVWCFNASDPRQLCPQL